MAKTNLESDIEQAANKFALQIVEAVKGATLQELIELRSASAPERSRLGRPRIVRPVEEEEIVRRKPGRPPKKKKVVKVAQKRKRTNFPKCAHPDCNKNRFSRGQGYCGYHWHEMKAGKIKGAESYKK